MGVIEESSSPWSSPILVLLKPKGLLHLCNDFRKLNKVTKFNSYPMPQVHKLIESQFLEELQEGRTHCHSPKV